MSILTTDRAPTYEEERGKPKPSRNHSIVQARLIIEFGKQSDLVFSELTLELGYEKHRTPDICVFREGGVDFRHDEVRATDPATGLKADLVAVFRNIPAKV